MFTFRNIGKNAEGAVFPLIALSIATIVAATGTAVDMGRAHMVQSKLASALDAAGLAAGATVNTTDVSTEVTKYMSVNFPSGYMGSTLTTLTSTLNTDKSKITLAATATVNTTFVRVLGYNTLTVSAQSEITRASKGMELVLVMDNTGSMDDSAGGGVSKLQAAKSAANTLVNILYGSKTTIDNLWIGLVPFSQTVNVGKSHTSWISANSFDWGPSPSGWMGCVDAREANSRDVTDDPPSVAKFPAYYWPDDSQNNWRRWDNGEYAYDSNLNSFNGPNKYCPTAITPLTATKQTVLNAISAMDAVGNTHINLGAVWGWRLLSPSWRPSGWSAEMTAANLPLNYNTSLMNKVVILMTDGDNTISNGSRGAYWYLDDEKLGTSSRSTAENRLDARTTQVCTSMKANGILVYTIALGTDIGTSAKNMLKGCASRPEYYFESPSNTALQAAFQTIGDSLANLRISK